MSNPVLKDKLRSMLEEDVAFGDITTEIVVDPEIARAEVVTREPGIAAGISEGCMLLEMCDLEVEDRVEDGARVEKGDVLLKFSGLNQSILIVERTLLNLMSRMCGIATATGKFIEVARKVNPRVKIAATRKTAPGLRWFDKRAVSVAGGDTHRIALYDGILVKDNHIAAVGDLALAVRRAKEKAGFVRKVEVEVADPSEAVGAAKAGADIIMLDNMRLNETKEALKKLKSEGLRDAILVEVSGGVSLENVEEIAKTGVDVISVGSLTHSVRSLDLALRFCDRQPSR